MAWVDSRNQLSAAIGTAVERIRSRCVIAGGLSAGLHLALLFVLIDMNVRAGDPSAQPVLFVENFLQQAPRQIDQQQPIEEAPLVEPEITPPEEIERLAAELFEDSTVAELLESDLIEDASGALTRHLDTPTLTVNEEALYEPATASSLSSALLEARSVEIAPAEQSVMIEHLKQAAQQLIDSDRSEITWQDAGREYRAVLTRESPTDSMEIERIAAQIMTTDRGASMQTDVWLSRLAFSQYSQVVDRWDPNVQLHDDEIIGRFHSNTSFMIRRSASATPKFSGKVTTAARGFRFASGAPRRRSEIFQGGYETSAQRIDFPQRSAPFAMAPVEADAHVHRFNDDAHITLSRHGTYEWQSRRADEAVQARYAPDKPLYLLADPKVTLFVRGVVDGRVLVYSPHRVVIEGNLTYADDPRANPDSDDYLGLVSDGTVEIARPYVTGRGDLRIDAAIFARRRFVVTDLDHHRSATLWIYGSLSAGTMSASEPRYATKIEFDPRLDRKRPPGFPSTNQFELERWEPAWRETSVSRLEN